MTTPNVPYRFELDLEIAGTPEQVWEAIATAGGISSWMMPAEIDVRPGGTVVFHMGPDVDSEGVVTSVEARRRLVYEEDWASLAGHAGANVTPLVTEFLIDARAGGTCAVRVVTSAFGTGADWENEFFGEMEAGWAPILDNLRLYVESFPGQTATSMWVSAGITGTPERAIDAVRDRLGVTGVGDRVALQGLDGAVERSLPRHLLLRVGGPVSGFLGFFSHGDGSSGSVNLIGYLFGDGAPVHVEDHQTEWQRWLDEVAAGVATSSPA